MVREFGVDMVTRLYLKWIANKDLLCSRGNSAECYVAVWMAEEWIWGRTDTSICMVGSLCCPPKTITTLLIDYTPIQNKKFKKNRERENMCLYKKGKRKEGTRFGFPPFHSFFPSHPLPLPLPSVSPFSLFCPPPSLFFSPCYHFPIYSLPHLHTYDASNNFGLLSNPDTSEQK